jgi:capsular exopolysaccharide synthesis family protein
MFSESVRGVRSAVMFGTQNRKKQVMVITSAVPGDGKTTFSVNFAMTLANAGLRVLLIDADLRRGTVSGYFSQKRAPGLTEILAREIAWQSAVQGTSVRSLHVIPSGRLVGNPGELLLGPTARQIVEQARSGYDHIIIDCPPVTAIDDTFCLLSFVDGLLFVVRAGQTSMRFAKTALAALRHRGGEILGVVLNGITADNPYYYYNAYYNAYYSQQAKHAAVAAPALSPSAPASTPLPNPAAKPATLVPAGAMTAKSAEDFKLRRATQRRANLALPGERPAAAPNPTAARPSRPSRAPAATPR